ncbi:MAG: hypothetical protein PSX37_10640 [bacterium]|nr:hypothetical protein [bacterium]
MNPRLLQIRNRAALLSVAGIAVGLALAGCSSSSVSAPSATTAPSSAPAASDGADLPGTAAMRALCNQMVTEGLSPEDATKLAEDNGYVARVGSIDGVPQAVTMDFREDRFTFDVASGAVTACTYG